MHGRPRKAPTATDEGALAIKADKLRSLQSQFLHNHRYKIYTDEALAINAKLLEINPEFMTAWNYRKLAFEHNLKSLSEKSDSVSIKSILDEELLVAKKALKKNFKSYGAWHHRKWVLSKGNSSTEGELTLLNQFQAQDSRNFHAWNYRRFIAALKGISDEDELQFTTKMINNSFSNYTAWHNRSVLLSNLLKKKVQGYFPKENCLTEEYELVRDAIFTEPDDQSGWFYHLWLLDQTVKLDTPILVSSWPPHGSSLYVPKDLDACALSSFTSSHAYTTTIPVILYFNEAVEGVNSCTVIIQAQDDVDKDIGWSPLSASNFGCARVWVAHLKIPNEKFQSSKAFTVRVSISHSQGITSLSGVPYSCSSYVAFTVHMRPKYSEHAEGKTMGRISLRDENFCKDEVHLKESSLINSFHQLRIDEGDKPADSKWNSKTIADEIALYRELLSLADCKIGKLTLARLLMAYDAMVSNDSPSAPTTLPSAEVLQLYCELMKLDPSHSQYYKDEHSLVLLKQVTFSAESLLSYCHRYKDSSSSLTIGDCICLRLNNLLLSRIGSIERLLWVQMLDLSHNQLQSIEGLEAMQLLSCLNLSNNKLGSFTVLDPLRLLKSLKVLDISYNEIGVHSVDTRRYLCSSPLCHTVASDWNFIEFAVRDVNVTNYWEAFSIFRGLELTQLDVIGNAAVDEKFKLFLLKLLPGLKWLDGEELC